MEHAPTWMSSAVKGILGGQPSRLTPTPPPWLSPQVLMRNSLPKLLPIPIVVVVIPTPKASASLLHNVSVAASANIAYFIAGACRADMSTRYDLWLSFTSLWAGGSCTSEGGVLTLATSTQHPAPAPSTQHHVDRPQHPSTDMHNGDMQLLERGKMRRKTRLGTKAARKLAPKTYFLGCVG